MAREFFKNLPDTSTPFSASRINGLLNGEEPMGSIVVEDIGCKNLYNPALVTRIGNNNYYEYEIDNTETYIFQTPYDWTIVYGIRADGSETRFLYEEGKTADSRIVTFVPTSEEVKIKCSFYTENPISDFTGVQLEKGSTATEYTPYKKFGYNSQESMGKIVVDDISSKNKFNKNDVTRGYFIDTDILWENANYAVSAYIPVEANEKYTFTGFDVYYTSCFDENFNYLGRATNSYSVVTTLENTKYIRATVLLADLDTAQIEKGDKATPYTPYKEFGYTTGNTNGVEWIKYDDGRCEFSGKVTIPAREDGNVVFPFKLINSGYSISSNYFYQHYALVFLCYHSMGETGFNISAFQPTNAKLEYEQTVSFHVVGRWK